MKPYAVFWFLSGIRIGAFVTLPITAVNLTELSVKQWPSLGVKTKFSKHATTYLLGIPELIEVIKEWDKEVREALPPDGLWFTPLSVDTGKIDPSPKRVGNNRTSRARKSLKAWLKKVELSYHKPHNFRHGHAVYSIHRAKDLSDLKAISMNLMHKNLQVTDGVYGIFSNIDIRKRIASLNDNDLTNNLSNEELISILEKTINNLKN